jgi:OOP family OmpA-OmpF porin
VSAESNTKSRADLDAGLPVDDADGHPSERVPTVTGLARRGAAQTQRIPPKSQDADLMQLRRLLLGMDYERLTAMRDDIARLLAESEALEDPVRQSDRVAGVLSEAMLLRENRDQGVSKALRSILSDAIKATVRQNPQPVIEAVSPVIGPAIRRSVNDAIASMLQLLDKLLEHNLSWQALQWRIEAFRTGRLYSEVVLLRTLIYRVEQVLLIHRETGLLLQHVESSQAGKRDPDLVGSMLVAIKDFVVDSFSAAEESPVQAMHVGDYKVMVEDGELAIIAAVARGNPPAELSLTMRETLETIEILYRDGLERFDGDASSFAETSPILEDCLQSQQRPPKGRKPWLAPALVVLALSVALGYWGFRSYQAHVVRSSALSDLRAEPGIVVTDAILDGDVYRIHGLRDPLAREPQAVIGSDARSAVQWEWDWRPYLSTESKLLLARATQALQPPSTVELSIEGGVLTLTGEAPRRWIDDTRIAAPRIPGISGYLDDALNAIDDADRTPNLWRAALGALRSEPGIVVAEANRDGKVARVHGLRDPLARKPEAVIGSEALSALRWEWDWRPFFSAEQEFLLERARKALRPPATVSLTLDDGDLQLTGEAPQQWIDAARSAVRGVPGITGYRDDALRAIDDTARLRETLARHREEIETSTLYFDVNAVQLGLDQMDRLDALAAAMKALLPIAAELDLAPGFVVIGHADATGSRAQNRTLSLSRARGVIEELLARGIHEHLFLPIKMGAEMPDEPAQTSESRALNRRVTFKVILRGDGADTATR